MSDLMGMDVLMVLANDEFRDEEYREPAAALAHAMAGVDIAAAEERTCRGKLGLTVEPDLPLIQVEVRNYEAIIFVGGNGSSVYFDDPVALKIAQDAKKQGKLVCAICIAPGILANAGILDGKKCTCFPSAAENLRKRGAKLVNEDVVKDGKIITANGPDAAHAFGKLIVHTLLAIREKREAKGG
jgi:protease I